MLTYRKVSDKCVLFVDCKSAYNNVNRDILWDIVSPSKILEPDELRFLKLLQDSNYFVAYNQRYYFKNEVGKGLKSSPGLFDIYIKEKCDLDLWYLLYTDDLVFVAGHH
jgi:hypothetical protein